MKCEQAQEMMVHELLDEVEPADRAELADHLQACSECRAMAREMSDLWRALRSIEAPPGDPRAVLRFGRRLERGRSRMRGTWVRIAAAVTLLLSGALVGRALAPGGGLDEAGGDARYLLLLRGDEPDRTQPAERLREEYGAWGAQLAQAGILVSAEELDPEGGRWVALDTVADPASTIVSGYFLVKAPSYDSAVAIARESPHADYGGIVEVRRIHRQASGSSEGREP